MLQKILVPIIQGKLFFLADYAPPKDIPNAFYFNIDQDLVYQPFYEDFGPLNIAKVWKYINEIYKILTNPSYSKNVFYHQTSLNYKKCCNSILLICAYQVVMMKKPAQQAFRPFQHLDLKPFRDASYGNCSYKCTILDCLMGLQYAMKLEWFCFKKFDLNSYEHFEQLENGDLNWIIPDKLIGFSSPYDKGLDQFGNKMLSPKDYLPIFKKLGVKTVIRFNSPTYDRENFTQNGINHYDLFFADGTPPSLQIVQKFLEIIESSKGAVAVHCKAGLGRTGCLIACYAMKHYKFSAAAFIGWIRLCRPGSILGPQQHFLVQIEENMHEKSDESPIWKQLKKKINPKQFQTLHLSMKKISGKQKEMNDDQTEVSEKGQHEQGKRLVDAKKHNHYVKNNKVSAL